MPDKQMVTTYEMLQDLEKTGLLNKLVQKGIVAITFLDYKNIYAKYLVHRRSKGKMDSYENTACECSVSSNTVRSIVYLMEK